MGGEKKSKQQRQEERRLLDDYHQLVTEEALEPLFQDFLKWKQGALPLSGTDAGRQGTVWTTAESVGIRRVRTEGGTATHDPC